MQRADAGRASRRGEPCARGQIGAGQDRGLTAGHADRRFERIGVDGTHSAVDRPVPLETPVAIEVGGIGYAVLMATPADLIDLAYGFCRAERLIDRADDIVEVDTHGTGPGVVVRVTLAARVVHRVTDRVRHRTTDSSCGLCGIENLEQALRPLPAIGSRWAGDDDAIFTALQAIDALQPLNRATRAVHGAAACAMTGEPRLVREDVGRHNAFDKVIGAMLRAGLGWDGGFALLTSRCSYELVEKAVLADCPMLATMSAPTTLALDRAAAAGLTLRVVARPDALLAASA